MKIVHDVKKKLFYLALDYPQELEAAKANSSLKGIMSILLGK